MTGDELRWAIPAVIVAAAAAVRLTQRILHPPGHHRAPRRDDSDGTRAVDPEPGFLPAPVPGTEAAERYFTGNRFAPGAVLPFTLPADMPAADTVIVAEVTGDGRGATLGPEPAEQYDDPDPRPDYVQAILPRRDNAATVDSIYNHVHAAAVRAMADSGGDT